MNNYYILKQFLPGVDVWVVKLDDNDTVYEYLTIEEAEAELSYVQSLYPNNLCKVGTK